VSGEPIPGLLELLERFPSWPHAPRGAAPSQVARFAASILGGARLIGWPDDERPRAVAALHDAPWDSEKLGVASARLFVVVPPDAADGTAALLDRALAAADAAGARYLVTRIDAGDVHVVQALEQRGFIVVDAILSQYLRPAESPPIAAPPDVHVRAAIPADGPALAALADESFTMSRFHWDPWIGPERGRAIYREWAHNIARGLNDVNLVAEIDGGVIGFLSCKDVPQARPAYALGYGRIELVAVAPPARGRHVIAALTARLVAECASAERRWDLLGIGTQIANVRAMRAYQRVGFAPGDSIFTLRRLV
jgi:GNAT superfamily N-acetyltransferase